MNKLKPLIWRSDLKVKSRKKARSLLLHSYEIRGRYKAYVTYRNAPFTKYLIGEFSSIVRAKKAANIHNAQEVAKLFTDSRGFLFGETGAYESPLPQVKHED